MNNEPPESQGLSKKLPLLSLSLILVIALAARLPGLGSHSLSIDEAVTWFTALRPLPAILPHMTSTCEVHPPLYFYGAHVWMLLGTSEWIMRLSSVIAGLLSIVISWLLGRELFGGRTAILGTLLLSLSSFHILLSQEFRMYPLIAALFTLSLFLFIRWKRGGSPGYLVLLTIVNTAGLYTHYLLFFPLVIENCCLIADFGPSRKLLRGWIVSQCATAFLYLPWILYYLRNNKGQDLTLRDAPGFWHIATLFSQMTWGPGFPAFLPERAGDGLLVGGIFTLLLSLYALRHAGREAGILCASGLLIPLSAAVLLSRFTPFRIFEFKYFLIIAPLFFLLIALLVCSMKVKAIAALFLALFLITNAISWARCAWDPRYQGQNWRGASAILQKFSSDDEVIVVHPSMMSQGIFYYYGGKSLLYPVDSPDRGALLKELEKFKRVWLCFTPHHPYVVRTGLARWMDRVLEEKNYALIPGETFIPSSVIMLKLYEVPSHKEQDHGNPPPGEGSP
ncbi:MAG: glycosyltransferase family 39 protein [Candidatus Eremiobacteraeota bacterium]|nr:glycosyltransferase family 39 protein [Candidatus Eremiobacteraeota bacterium]